MKRKEYEVKIGYYKLINIQISIYFVNYQFKFILTLWQQGT